MKTFTSLISELIHVKKPAQYIGNELNAVVKHPEKDMLRMALAFPDLYEIGMSYTGFQILYHMINSENSLFAERVFAPGTDMEALMRKEQVELFTLETKTPCSQMDIIGFSFQFELSYTNVLQMLDLSNIPLKSADRTDGPLIFAGGPCVYNPEPMSEFIDVFYIGEAETQLVTILKHIQQMKKEYISREKILNTLDDHYSCLYIPQLSSDKRIKRTFPETFTSEDFPHKLILPNTSTVYDRVTLEISRGCDQGCRFCQAGIIYRPARERSPEDLMSQSENLLKNTGHDEISLSSLSTADYPGIENLVEQMVESYYPERISIALPSMRADKFREEFAEHIRKIRKTGFTIAPEAGSDRLRRIINKNLTDEDIISASSTAYKFGWDHIKLYFMIGLPGETEEDLEGIVNLCEKVARLNRRGYVVLSLSTFVPKAHTPFQWARQISLNEIIEKQMYIKSLIRSKNIRYKYHEATQSVIESLLARGARDTGAVIENVFKQGGRFDGWSDSFDFDRWKQALSDTDFDIETISQDIDENTVFPWDFIDTGVDRGFLLNEWKQSLQENTTIMCHSPASCNSCKACSPEVLKQRFKEREKMAEALAKIPVNSQSDQTEADLRVFILFSFSKTGLLKFASHLDIKTILFRSFRMSGLPLAFSKGFNPRPQMSFGPALEVGVEGLQELFVCEFNEPFHIEKAIEKLNRHLPEDISIISGSHVPMEKRNMLSGTSKLTYSVEINETASPIPFNTVEFIKKSKRKTKKVKLSDYITSVKNDGENRFIIEAVHSQEGGSIKSTDMVKYLFPDINLKNVIIKRRLVKPEVVCRKN